jgi:hypothetical protein
VDPLSRHAVTDAAAAADGQEADLHDASPAVRDRASAIYGSLLVVSLVAVQARSDAVTAFIAATVVVGVGVFWLTEVWTELITLRTMGPITRGQALLVAGAELPMLSAAILPTVLLASASLGLTTPEQATSLALAAGIGQLFVWGLIVGAALGRGWPAALVVAVVDCALGLLIVALKVWVLH